MHHDNINMKEEELVALVNRIRLFKSEQQTIEIKEALKCCSNKLFDTLSSFSNQDDGGVIVFGISESSGYEITGVYNAEALEKDVTEQCSQIEPPVRPLFTVALIDGKTVVSAEIPGIPFSKRPAYYKGKGLLKGSYIRVGEADIQMSPYEVYSYDAFHRGLHDDRRPVRDAALSLLDKNLLDSYVSRIRNTRNNLANLAYDEVLKLLGIVKDGYPSLAAVMAFSHYPQSYFPQFSVTAVVISGDKKGNENEIGMPRFQDSRRFTGNIKDMLDAAVGYALDNIRNAISFDENGNRVNKPEYPPVAIREAVLNALQHRDYSAYSEGKAIRIEIYSDRLEITNSGGLYGPLSIDKIGTIPPETRNPTLSDILEVLGVSENRGSGIPAIRNSFRAMGLEKPVFKSERGEFKVIFFNALRKEKEADNILDFLKTPRSRGELEAFTGLNRTSLYYRIIKPMIADGLIRMTIPEKPKSKRQCFVLV